MQDRCGCESGEPLALDPELECRVKERQMEIAAEQFHIYLGADQLITVHENTFEPGVQAEGVARSSKTLLA